MKQTSLGRAYFSGALGNIIEWYDFSIYGYFSVILAKLFFPHKQPLIRLMETFAIFGLGFLMRPLGAILFGHIGDCYGRKKALILAGFKFLTHQSVF